MHIEYSICEVADWQNKIDMGVGKLDSPAAHADYSLAIRCASRLPKIDIPWQDIIT